MEFIKNNGNKKVDDSHTTKNVNSKFDNKVISKIVLPIYETKQNQVMKDFMVLIND